MVVGSVQEAIDVCTALGIFPFFFFVPFCLLGVKGVLAIPSFLFLSTRLVMGLNWEKALDDTMVSIEAFGMLIALLAFNVLFFCSIQNDAAAATDCTTTDQSTLMRESFFRVLDIYTRCEYETCSRCFGL